MATPGKVSKDRSVNNAGALEKLPLLRRYGFKVGLAAAILLALLGTADFWLRETRQPSGSGFPLDDSWIHLQIARNLAGGQGWSFNPGEPTGAATAPLWVLIITPLFLLGGNVVLLVKLLGVALCLACVLLVANVAVLATADRRAGVVAGMAAAMQPAFLWAALSGMETMLYLVLFLLSLRSLLLVERRGRWAAYASTGWLVLAGWARPEMWAMLPLFWGYLFWRRRELSVGHWWLHGAIATLGVGGFALFNLALWGYPYPATLAAKQAHLHGAGADFTAATLRLWTSHFFASIAQILRSQNVVLLTCLAAPLLVVRRRPAIGQRLLLFLGVITVGAAVIAWMNLGNASFQAYRRSAHLLVSMNVLMAVGSVAMYDLAKRLPSDPGKGGRRRFGVIVVFAAGSALVIQMQAVWAGGSRYVNDVRSINQGDVAAGRWLAANTPANAYVAANDIGAIAYFGQRRVFDMIGLASPEAIAVLRRSGLDIEVRDQAMKELLLAQGVDYVVIFPDWFPWLARNPMLHEVQRFTVHNPTSLAGSEVVAYRLQ